jgi:hypothetical protein
MKSMVASKARGDDPPSPRSPVTPHELGSKRIVQNWLKSIRPKLSSASLNEAKIGDSTPAENVPGARSDGSESPQKKDPDIAIDQSLMGKFLSDSEDRSTVTSETLVTEITAGTDTSALIKHLD